MSAVVKKKHGIKNLILCEDNQLILYLSPTESGSMHDKAMADECPIELPNRSVLRQNLGFLGHRPQNVIIEEPFKNRRCGQNLSLHPHLHCIVPSGGVDAKGNWHNLRADGKFLFSVKAMSTVFRAKYVAELSKQLKIDKATREALFLEKLD